MSLDTLIKKAAIGFKKLLHGSNELSEAEYYSKLSDADRHNVGGFISALKCSVTKSLDIAIFGVGSVTYPDYVFSQAELDSQQAKARPYNDIDLKIVAHDKTSYTCANEIIREFIQSRYQRLNPGYRGCLDVTFENWLQEGGTFRNGIVEYQSQPHIRISFQPDSEGNERKPIHVLLINTQQYTNSKAAGGICAPDPLFDEKLHLERKKNNPFCVLYSPTYREDKLFRGDIISVGWPATGL